MASDPVNVSDFTELAKQALPKAVYDFFAGGAEDEWTLKQNTAAFQTFRLRPRVLVDSSHVDLSTNILGYKISAPIMIAPPPTSMHKLAHPEGELATARATADAGTIMVLSSSSTSTVEEVAATSDAVHFFQLYIYKNRDISSELLRRAERSGYKALVLTVDTPKLGNREADIRNNHTELVQDIKWLQSITNLPILVKGILTAEDAELAVQTGAAGIVVSNHGGRQLDFASASITSLEEVVHAVRGRVPVLFDGGIRCGTDVFKALALGVQAVLVGRPVIFGLAAKGESGVKKLLEMLHDELELAMSLCGCPSVKDITRSHVRTEHEMMRYML